MGASRPLTAAIALALARAGADLAVTSATPDAEEAFAVNRLAKRINDLGRRGFAESLDISLGTNVQVAVRQVAKLLGRIDLLVLAPDLRLDRPAERLSDADWARLTGVNLSGVFYACRSVAREMQRQDAAEGALRGRIVLLTSPQADLAESDAAYVAAKAGALALVEALARQWPDIRLTAIEASLDSTEDATIEAVLRASGL